MLSSLFFSFVVLTFLVLSCGFSCLVAVLSCDFLSCLVLCCLVLSYFLVVVSSSFVVVLSCGFLVLPCVRFVSCAVLDFVL